MTNIITGSDISTAAMHLFITLLILGSFGGFLSGMLGIGGAIVMIPLMLTIPPLLGLPTLDMKTVAGLSMIQVIFASISGVLRHRRHNFVDNRLLILLGSTMATGTFIGAFVSKYINNAMLMIIFGILALTAGIMMFLKPPGETTDQPAEAHINLPLTLIIGLIIGSVSGMVGAGGGFILIPIMIYVLRIPTRITIGTSLGVVMIGAIAGGIGKIATGQVMWLPALALILGAVPFAQLGATVSKKLPTRVLHILLIVIITATCIQIWWKILFTH
ncbi:MAG: sulfite exporter TauE/SafE family protein [Spirochaetes bacterium]|nr:sulfite exporter TauE/SafE family protein [Spirochaetota bacterium]